MILDRLDAVLDTAAAISIALSIYYILKMRSHGKNPYMMVMSPIVLNKYLIFLVGLLAAFFALDVVADNILADPRVLIYGFEFGLALGSIGILMMVKRVHEQVSHPEGERAQKLMRGEIDAILDRRFRYQEEKFRKENK